KEDQVNILIHGHEPLLFEGMIAAANEAANVEKAQCEQPVPPAVPYDSDRKPMLPVSTPGKKSVEEVAAFLDVAPTLIVKTLIYKADDKVVAVLMRGDHEVNEIKLKKLTGANDVVLADKATVESVTGAPSGFAGPQGLIEKGIPVYEDVNVPVMTNFVTGGNAQDKHFINVNSGVDFKFTGVADLRKAVSGDQCPKCTEGKIEIYKGIEVGHIFMLGAKYSKAMGCTFLDDDGTEKP
ncbi:MAG: YbaK/EbsC family protein, partial [Nitrospirota bacterium]